MRKARKQQLHDKCFTMLTRGYSDGGIASYNEYNQFLCDNAPKMLQYMSVEGLEWLREQLQEQYDNIPDFDKD